MLKIQTATVKDIPTLLLNDRYMSTKELARIIPLEHVLMAFNGDKFVGWLRYGLFWDKIPFVNMISVLEPERDKGYGMQLMLQWEKQMREEGFKRVMASTRSNEEGQHFYRKLGYRDAGCLLLPDEPLELVFSKILA